ncbi:MAG TPA: DNA-directed RNA polymerase subunit omega [Pyrinomonadaceae bacterium]|nr:DNA-directed RNA polymerase subunit omega [Pyrinomonadaceae bacterium]
MATTTEMVDGEVERAAGPEVDSKYRLIILAAKRSKQLQRGAQPRIEIDPQKHKPTRIALEEVMRGRVHFDIKQKDGQQPE